MCSSNRFFLAAKTRYDAGTLFLPLRGSSHLTIFRFDFIGTMLDFLKYPLQNMGLFMLES